MPRLARWRGLVDGLRQRRYGHGEGAPEARRLVAAKYQPTTMQRYVNSWEAFVDFCGRTGLRSLPAAPETVVRYMGTYLAAGTVKPETVNNYLAAIRAVHRVAGLPSPTDDPEVADAKVGFRRLQVEAAGALPEVRAPLPAEVILAIAHKGLRASDAAIERECAGLVLGFLMCNRPGAAPNVRAKDVAVLAGGLCVQVPLYKMGILKAGTRLAFRIPVGEGGWAADGPLRLVRRLWLRHFHAGCPAGAHLFAAPGCAAFLPLPTMIVTVWLRQHLTGLPYHPAPGTKWTGHSLRAGAVSAVDAVGLSPALIIQLMGLASVKTAFEHYIDAQLENTPAAKALFSRYLPRTVPV